MEEERRKRAEAEKELDEEKGKREGVEEEKKRMEGEERKRREEEKKCIPISSVDGASVTFADRDGIKREGSATIHPSCFFRNSFIGGVITSVYFYYLSVYVTTYLSSIVFFISDLCMICYLVSDI